MKGLLIKDFKLIKCQKNFFVTIIVLAAGIAVLKQDMSFVIGYMTFLGPMLTLSSISYDEFDNGNAFLFSLPITRKGYVMEKYVFGFLISGSFWLFATVLTIIAEITNSPVTIMDTIMSALLVLLLFLAVLAVFLPLIFKCGIEKFRVAIICVTLIGFGSVFLIAKIAALFHVDLNAAFNNLSTMSMGMLFGVVLGIAIAVLFLSYRISVAIIKRKEF